MTPKNPSIFNTPKNSVFDSVYENERNISETKKMIKSEVKIVSTKKRNFEQTLAKSEKINRKIHEKKEKINETINLLENENENENGNENENENENENMTIISLIVHLPNDHLRKVRRIIIQKYLSF